MHIWNKKTYIVSIFKCDFIRKEAIMRKIFSKICALCTIGMSCLWIPIQTWGMAQDILSCQNTIIHETDKALEEPKNLYAKGAVLMDAKSGRVLFGKNADTVMPNASTTKVMTCILALESGKSDDILTVSKYAASMPKVHLGMREGQKFRMEDLLYSLMLESHNDSAVAIAEGVGGSVQHFSEMMNEKARELGCRNTTFLTPNGLDAEKTQKDGSHCQHGTTAHDLAQILSYCITKSPQKENFLKITQTRTYQFRDQEGGSQYSCCNHNAFLDMMDGAMTGKTGFTAKAGYCYVGALEREGHTLVVALLACGWPNHKTYKWSDTRTLMQYGLDAFSPHSIDRKKITATQLPRVEVQKGQTDAIGQVSYASLKIEKSKDKTCNGTILLKQGEKITMECQIARIIEAPVKEGTVIGQICYRVNSETFRTNRIIIDKSIPAIDFFWCFKQVSSCFFL